MRIGTVANRVGVPASTVRYYEATGLIDRQPRVSGRRDFDEQAVRILQFVRLAQAAGFTIAETKALLERRAATPGPPDMWKPFVEAKQAAVRKQMKDLRQMNRILSALADCTCPTLNECVEAAMTQLPAKDSGGKNARP